MPNNNILSSCFL